MFKSKFHLTCSYCAKIFKDPILLSCDDSICREHLSERDIRKENKIKCKECNQEFKVNDDEFRSNKTLRKLIESESYLSGEEISLKVELEVSVRKFFEFYDEFNQKKTQLELDAFEHFKEMRFQIDEHREELKKRIDDIALAMIDETKKYETTYLKNIKEKLSSFDHCKSLQTKLNEVEETFRNPNLLIESIREMQHKQEESLKDIQFKLNQMTIVKDNLKATNGFMPNISLLNQKTSPLFGSIKLNGHCFNENSLNSQILTNQQSLELIKLCEFSPNGKWSLMYRATRDGFSSNDFHSKCDGHANTLTIIKAKQSEFIFGGFTTVSWDSSSTWKSDPNAFIFSLTNKDNKPIKMKVDSNEHENAICCDSEFGPTFGYDINIYNNANTTMDSYSRLGDSYKHSQYAKGTHEAETFLAGSYEFQLNEIEVYKKE
jgi:hypothetical protein